jgi:hypothetical protein
MARHRCDLEIGFRAININGCLQRAVICRRVGTSCAPAFKGAVTDGKSAAIESMPMEMAQAKEFDFVIINELFERVFDNVHAQQIFRLSSAPAAKSSISLKSLSRSPPDSPTGPHTVEDCGKSRTAFSWFWQFRATC